MLATLKYKFINSRMNEPVSKRKILEAGLKRQQTILDDFRDRIRDMMAQEGTVTEEEYDLQVQAMQATRSAEVSLLSEQLNFARQEMEELRKLLTMIDMPRNRAEWGAVIETDRKTFFVSASLEKFEVEGKVIYGISTRSPLFLTMKGCKTGDGFAFRGKEYVIKNIY